MAGVRNVGPEKWEISIYLGRDKSGKKNMKYFTFEGTEKQAEKFGVKKELEYANKSDINDNILLKNHLLEWIDFYSEHIKPLTEESYRQQINAYLIPHLGKYKLSNLTTKIIDDFYIKMRKEGRIRGKGGLSKRSVRYLHTILQKSLDTAIDWNRLQENPCKKTTPPTYKKTKKKEIKPNELIEIIQNTKNIIYKNLFEFTLRTGLRRGEVIGLLWKNVDWNNKILTINKSLQRLDNKGFFMQMSTKNNEAYTLPLTKKAIELLKKIKAEQAKWKLQYGTAYKKNKLIFCNEDGSPFDPDSVTNAFKRQAKQCGHGKYTFHDLRHGFGTIQTITGTHTKTLQELLNHKTMETTANTYSHILEEQKIKAMKKIDNFF